MKRIIQKKQRPGRKKINRKVSTMVIAANQGKPRTPRTNRLHRRNNMPNSSKVGAGQITARRNLPMGQLHKRNHRSGEMMQRGEVLRAS